MTDEIYSGRMKKDRKIIKQSIHRGYEYVITSLGSHPCAYVIIDETHPLYQNNCMEWLGIVHGGVTYSEAILSPIVNVEDNKWVIGWDYAHAYDYYCIDPDNERMNMQGKKWSVDEIMDDVKLMIDYLIETKKAPPTPK